MVFIHQNRAHQRILYEDFLTKMTVGEAMSQALLFPINFQFDKSDMLLLKDLKEDLESSGFQFEAITDEAVVIKGIPSQMDESQLASILDNLIAAEKEDLPDTSFSHVDYIAKTLAKSTAIKVGQPLNSKEQEELVDNLFSCKDPNISPFEQACFTTLTLDEIDNRL